MSTWLITGASRGFGRQLTAAVLKAGDQVIATARDPQAITDAFPDASDKLAAVALDVTDAGQAASAVAAGVERFDSIDVVVNNAGYGLFGSVEDTPDDDVRALFDTNVFGLLNVTRAVVPVLREQGHGRILNMSSSAGLPPVPAAAYTARRSSRWRRSARRCAKNLPRSGSRSR